MTKFTTIITILISCLLLESCNASKENTDEWYNEQCNAYFEVHGPVKKIEYTVAGPEAYTYYTLNSVDFNKKCQFKKAEGNSNLRIDEEKTTMKENHQIIAFYYDADFDGDFTFSIEKKQNRLSSITLVAAPEYDGYNLELNYDKSGEIKDATLTDLTWDPVKNKMKETKYPMTLKDSDVDSLGNWRARSLSGTNGNIIINRTITYYTPEELSKDTAETVSIDARADTANPFAKVTKWDITLTAMTTILKDVSAEEAEKINNSNPEDYGYDDYWAGQDEETRQWEAHITTMTEVGKGTVADSEIVHQLNEMMLDPQYADYRKDVRINGTTAIATWYTGNRGGGIGDDFPESLSKDIFSACNY